MMRWSCMFRWFICGDRFCAFFYSIDIFSNEYFPFFTKNIEIVLLRLYITLFNDLLNGFMSYLLQFRHYIFLLHLIFPQPLQRFHQLSHAVGSEGRYQPAEVSFENELRVLFGRWMMLRVVCLRVLFIFCGFGFVREDFAIL